MPGNSVFLDVTPWNWPKICSFWVSILRQLLSGISRSRFPIVCSLQRSSRSRSKSVFVGWSARIWLPLVLSLSLPLVQISHKPCLLLFSAIWARVAAMSLARDSISVSWNWMSRPKPILGSSSTPPPLPIKYDDMFLGWYDYTLAKISTGIWNTNFKNIYYLGFFLLWRDDYVGLCFDLWLKVETSRVLSSEKMRDHNYEYKSFFVIVAVGFW